MEQITKQDNYVDIGIKQEPIEGGVLEAIDTPEDNNNTYTTYTPNEVSSPEESNKNYTINTTRESEQEDYWNVFNPLGVSYNNPELRYNPDIEESIEEIDMTNEEFKTLFDSVDGETKVEMLKANNSNDAKKIAYKRLIFNESQIAISKDGVLEQLGKGILPSLASPSTLLPFGYAFKAAQTAEALTAIAKGVQIAGVGAVTGAIANVGDEALFDVQSMPTNYIGAATAGVIMGGGLGFLIGSLSGPNVVKIASNLEEANKIYDELDVPPLSRVETDGSTPDKMDKSLIDTIPFLGKALRSDVHTVLQSDSPILRKFMLKMSSGTTTIKDLDGNVLIYAKNGMDVKREAIGLHNSLNKEIEEAYREARLNGYTGTMEKFYTDIWEVYTAASTTQRNKANAHANKVYEKEIEATNEAKKLAVKAIDDEIDMIKDTTSGKYRELTEEEAILKVKDDEGLAAYKVEEDTYNNIVKSINDEATNYINTMLEQYKKEGKTKAELKALKKDLEVIVSASIVHPPKPIKPTPLLATPTIKKQRPKKVREAMKQEVKSTLDTKLSETIKKEVDDWYTKDTTSFKGTSYVNKGAEAYRKYYNSMLAKGKELNINALKNINKATIYAPRTYNYRDIQNGKVSNETLLKEIRAGLLNDVRNKAMTKQQLDNATESIALFLKETAFKVDRITTSFLSKDLPLGSRLMQSKLYLNESYMPSIVNRNMDELAGIYSYSMSGRHAVQYAFGTDQLGEVMNLIRADYMKQGIIPKKGDIEAFTRVVEDLLGTLRMNPLSNTSAWTFTRKLTAYNSLRLMGGAGGNQVIELFSLVLSSGISSLMSGRLFKSLSNTSDLLFSHKGKYDEFSNYLVNSGFMEEALHTSRANRYADTESGFNSGALENTLHNLNDKQMKFNGMRYFMGVMEDYAGSVVVTKLKNGSMDKNMAARLGLSMQDVKELQQSLKEVTFKDWDLSAMTQTQRDKLQLAISRGISEAVIQGDSIHLPAWLKAPGPFTKVLTQFMRFPLIAQEVLFRRGFKEEQGKLIAGITGAIMSYLGLKYLREQAAVSLGIKDVYDLKYDYTNYTEEDWTRAIGESLNYAAPLGFISSLYNYGAIATGNNELGRDWASRNTLGEIEGPSGGLLEDTVKLTKAVVDGEITDEKNVKKVLFLLPFSSMPLVREGVNTLAEEYGD